MLLLRLILSQPTLHQRLLLVVMWTWRVVVVGLAVVGGVVGVGPAAPVVNPLLMQ